MKMFLDCLMPTLSLVFCHLSENINLKGNFFFVIDNGQSEKSHSPIMKMCLKHLVSFFNIGSETHVSFAECYSNFDECVHAEINKDLQKYGVILSLSWLWKVLFRNGMDELRNKMTAAIKQATFGSVPIFTFNGIENGDFIFKDEERLKTFLSLPEETKLVYDIYTYTFGKNDIMNVFKNIYYVDKDFSSSYKEDNEALSNTKYNGILTTWADKYTAMVYNEEKI